MILELEIVYLERLAIRSFILKESPKETERRIDETTKCMYSRMRPKRMYSKKTMATGWISFL